MSSWQSALVKPVARILNSRMKTHEPIVQQRRANDELSSRIPFPENAIYTSLVVEGMPAAWVRKKTATVPEQVILYLHGGAYISGSLLMYRSLLARFAHVTGARVLMIEYRLAPEHPYPAAVDDAYTAYHWLLKQNIKPEQIVVLGDSAGGGLAIALLLKLRDHREALPAAVVCLSPWLDLALTGESMRTRAGADVILSPQKLQEAAEAYLGTTSLHTPYASPLYADLQGLPPMLLQVGTEEVLLDDARRFALRAQEAGNTVTLEVWPKMIHSWQTFGNWLPEARQARERIGQFVRAASASL